MDFKDLQTKPKAELEKLLTETRQELHEIRMKVSANQHKNVRQVRVLRVLQAQLLTLLNASR